METAAWNRNRSNDMDQELQLTGSDSGIPYNFQKLTSRNLLPPAMAYLQNVNHNVGDPRDMGHLAWKITGNE